MINFNNSMLKNFIEQNENFFINARIQKIQQPTRKEFIITLRNAGEIKKLYINIDASFYHICFMEKENEQKRKINIPQQPPMFCMLLRKYLGNAKISKINQPQYERILEIYTEVCNELNEKIYLCLAIELMGRHSNVILYNTDTNMILGCAHNVGFEKSREREIRGGVPYIYPPHNINYWFEYDNFDIDNYYAQKIFDYKFKTTREKYRQIVLKKIKKNSLSFSKLLQNEVSDEKMNSYRYYGNLILANLYNNHDFLKSITVFDYENNNEITIELDSTKTLKENANKYYKLYSKAKNSKLKSTEILQQLNDKKIYLEQLLYSIDYSETFFDLNDIADEVIDRQNVTNKKIQKPIEFKSDEYTIWVGKNNKQNDYIVSKLAKDNDLWFHTHNIAGSHVLLRTNNLKEDLILKCAKLAKEYSSGKLSSKVGVIYTFAKFLKKPPKSALGYVTYSKEKEIIID